MIRPGETLEDGGTTQAAVAIVGAGPVGIALAIRLAGRIGNVVLVEAGGERFKSADHVDYFGAERVDDALHGPTDINRRRMLGGTSSVWGGRCIPFDPEDFAPTPARPGWAIPFSAFEAHLADALDFLDAGPPVYSAASVLPTRPLPLPSADLLLDRIERYSKPTNLWRKWRHHIEGRRDVTVIHEAACTEILTGADGARATGLALLTASHKRHTVLADTIVLACGGLETPRLLLASRGARPSGLGNDKDLVGRFYMAHLVSSAENAGFIRFRDPATARAFDFTRTTDGIYGRRMMLLTAEARQRETLPNIVFRPNRPAINDPAHRDAVLSTMFMVRNLLIPPEYERSLTTRKGRLPPSPAWRAHIANIARDLPGLGRFSANWVVRHMLATRKLPSVFLYRRDGLYPLEFNAEQMPTRESRVQLGTETDRLGLPRLLVQWRYQPADLEGICRAFRVFASAVSESGLGEVAFGPDLRETVQRALVAQGGHHIGTARMGGDPQSGVVDPDCEVWDCQGLFVAGTAVLPTSGFANPTLTAVALALRLSEHLVARTRRAAA